jgi:E3 SUMO-protein ligase PIAS1
LHPQWHCPLCNKELRFEDLIVDGCVASIGLEVGLGLADSLRFFLEILNTVPDTYDEVLMESSGEWHTPDNKYGSASWIANLPSASVAPTPAPPPGSEPTPAPAELVVKTESPDTKGKRKAIEILSSDDEDDEPLSRPNGHSHTPSSSLPIRPITLRIPSASSLHSRATPINGPPSSRPSAQPSTSDVIDLTLSSDEEEEDEADSETIPGFRRPVDASTSRGVGDSIPRLPSLRHLASGGLSTGNGTGAGWPDEWSWEKELGQLVDSAAPLRNRDPLGAAGYPSYRDGANLNGKRGRGSDSTDEDAADRLRDPDWEDEYGV